MSHSQFTDSQGRPQPVDYAHTLLARFYLLPRTLRFAFMANNNNAWRSGRDAGMKSQLAARAAIGRGARAIAKRASSLLRQETIRRAGSAE